MRPRDNQRKKVYDSERECTCWNKYPIENIQDIKKYVKKILKSSYITSNFGTLDPYIQDGRGCRFARGSRHRLVFPKWSRFKMVILHELAHAITPNRYAPHGKEFCANFVMLVKYNMEEKYALELIQAFNKNNVDFYSSRFINR